MRKITAGVFLILVCCSAIASDDLKLFFSDGPTKEYPGKMMLFGQFVGDWDIDYHAYLKDGSKVATKCEWHWRWGLDGKAVLDSFICPSRTERVKPGAPKGEWGITVRDYDPTIDAWHIVFIGPAYNNVNVLIAHKVGGDIVLEGKNADDSLNKWMFTEITPRSFHWKGYTSGDHGKTWDLREEMFVKRQSGSV
jgi:hypothetical protein